jgi:tartrate-resistant acid phosphatase type 5
MTILATVTLLSAVLLHSATATFNFASIGDWGCVPIGGYHEQDELIVAKQFAKTAADVNARFVLNTGDNFYYCGVHNSSDPMFDNTFEAVFTEPSTMVPWYTCLGNHDYGYPGSATAQIEYKSPNNNRWVLPDRYYYQRLSFPGEVNISLVVLDASPCQSAYTGNNPAKYDPCGTVIPGCPGCTFHQNVVAQSCSQQYSWLQGVLPTIPADDWKIVMIHAPAGDIDNEDFTSLLQQAGFQLYINGHVHVLTHYTMDNAGTYVTTGAGCMVRVPSGELKTDVLDPVKAGWTPTSCSNANPHHTCQVVFEQQIAGYTSHSFSADFETLSTYFYDYQGNLLHTAVTPKSGNNPPTPSGSSSSGNPPPPPSPPTPPTPPAPAGSCCYYRDAACKAGQICCNDEGHSYAESTCDSSNGKKHDCSWTNGKCIVQ